MIVTWKEVYCDACHEVIGHYSGSSKAVVNAQIKNDGGTVKGNKHFCNKICELKKKGVAK